MRCRRWCFEVFITSLEWVISEIRALQRSNFFADFTLFICVELGLILHFLSFALRGIGCNSSPFSIIFTFLFSEWYFLHNSWCLSFRSAMVLLGLWQCFVCLASRTHFSIFRHLVRATEPTAVDVMVHLWWCYIILTPFLLRYAFPSFNFFCFLYAFCISALVFPIIVWNITDTMDEMYVTSPWNVRYHI